MTKKEWLIIARNISLAVAIGLIIIALATSEKISWLAVPIGTALVGFLGYQAAEGDTKTKLQTGAFWGSLAFIFTLLAVLTS